MNPFCKSKRNEKLEVQKCNYLIVWNSNKSPLSYPWVEDKFEQHCGISLIIFLKKKMTGTQTLCHTLIWWGEYHDCLSNQKKLQQKLKANSLSSKMYISQSCLDHQSRAWMLATLQIVFIYLVPLFTNSLLLTLTHKRYTCSCEAISHLLLCSFE